MTAGTWGRLAGLELTIDELRTERRATDVSSGFTRVTTTIVLAGAGHEGRGEDVTYAAADHDAFPEPDLTWAPHARVARRPALDGMELFPGGAPEWAASTDYRRWGFESAALDLALRQGGVSLGEAVGRSYRPVRFVVSTRLDPREWLAVDPSLEFKLDPTSEWSDAFMREVAATESVRCLDFKSYYHGTVVDQPPDPALYATARRALLDARSSRTPRSCRRRATLLRGVEDRLSFDAPVHSLADVDALPVAPRWLNIKPSRFGTLARLFECIDACEARGVTMYGGGQFELGYGRGQIQALASLFYADGPNDVAPGAYNEPVPRGGLPGSPLTPPERPVGFSWES